MGTEEYREAPPPTRAEFLQVQDRISALEASRAKPPKAPMRLRWVHALVGGLVVACLCPIAIGVAHDAMGDTGARVGVTVALVMVCLAALVAAVISLFLPWGGKP